MLLDELLSRARKRIVGDRLLRSLSLSGVVFASGLLLLLILGTAILSWQAVVLLLAICAGLAFADAVRASPSTSKVARLLDERCGLADTLATAVHFRESTSPMAAGQRSQATAAAESIDVAQAIPFLLPRSLYALAVLGIAASGLLIYRLQTERDLSLRAPIVKFHLDALGLPGSAEEKANEERKRKASSREAAMPEAVVNHIGTSTSDDPLEKDSAGPAGSAVTSGAQNGKESPDPASADGKKTGSGRQEAGESSQAGASAPKPGGEQPPSSRDGTPQTSQAGSKSPGHPDSSGLLSKLRDAVSSLLSKKPEGNPSPSNGTQTAQQPNGKAQSGQAGAPQQGKPEAQGTPSDQEGQESASTDAEQTAPGKGAGKNSDQTASAKPGSGMGHQDGSKELKDAEQLSAMGKLSEIIGKRSANVTGEMTIEPQNGPQELKTGYTHSAARHGEASGDINRDDVPLALQGYVQQYYDQVRKQAAEKARRPSP